LELTPCFTHDTGDKRSYPLNYLNFTHRRDVRADYRGEVKIILANLGSEPFGIGRGDRIAQLVPAPVQRALLDEVDALEDSAWGNGGFGSTGR
jgi:deoxyuridine 5'-triphosphate nucleotidohydrolase